MITRADIIAEARSWKGTPWRHQGRLKGIACDCVGFIIKVPAACGLIEPEFDYNGYSRYPEPALMKRLLDEHLDRIEPAVPQAADVLWLRPRGIPQHLGIYTGENSLIHAIDARRGVTEHILDERWKRAITAVYRYRGIED